MEEKNLLEEREGSSVVIEMENAIFPVNTPLNPISNGFVFWPLTISIGPYYYGKHFLKRMEDEKLSCFHTFIKLFNLNPDQFTHVIKGYEVKIRGYYAPCFGFDLTSDEFVRMVMLDGCFIILVVLFHRHPERIHERPTWNLFLHTDMILLENQLPFFVLDLIYHLAFPNEPETKFIELSICYLWGYVLMNKGSHSTMFNKVEKYLDSSGHEIKHFVDLLRLCHLPTILRTTLDNPTPESETMLNATELWNSGITLMKGSRNFAQDIQYSSSNGVLKIPQITVCESWKYMICNVLALEMCLYRHDSYVTDFMFFMNLLIDTPKDIDLLVKKGIVKGWLPPPLSLMVNKETVKSTLVNFFKQLACNFPISATKFYFYDISQDLRVYHRVPRHRWMAILKHHISCGCCY